MRWRGSEQTAFDPGGRGRRFGERWPPCRSRRRMERHGRGCRSRCPRPVRLRREHGKEGGAGGLYASARSAGHGRSRAHLLRRLSMCVPSQCQTAHGDSATARLLHQQPAETAANPYEQGFGPGAAGRCCRCSVAASVGGPIAPQRSPPGVWRRAEHRARSPRSSLPSAGSQVLRGATSCCHVVRRIHRIAPYGGAGLGAHRPTPTPSRRKRPTLTLLQLLA
jgi:hypothetical protein